MEGPAGVAVGERGRVLVDARVGAAERLQKTTVSGEGIAVVAVSAASIASSGRSSRNDAFQWFCMPGRLRVVLHRLERDVGQRADHVDRRPERAQRLQ